jgi:tRNA nucleotidyltransferase (CCA-adding enzyme)
VRKVQEELRERIRALPGMERLLPALAGLPPVHLVGGAVRDLLLGQPVVDVDLAVEGDGPRTARELAARLDGDVSPHERFGTATVRAGTFAFDIAATRSETYPEPGALPVTQPAGLGEDLGRRDFAINAMAAALQGDELGHLHDPHGGSADLEARVVRVLHDRSFIDDPTRLLRAVRYEVRLDFEMDEPTEELAREAARRKALATVSGPRIRDELLDLLGEHAAPRGVARLMELGLLETLGGDLTGDPDLVASAKLGAGETSADPALSALAALASPEPDAAWVESLALRADERDAVLRAARKAPQLAKTVRADMPDSAIHALLHCEHPETLALTLAYGAPGGPILRYLADLQGVRLEITGKDLVDAGVPESRALGYALEETLRKKLDGELAGRDEELRYALEVARSEKS